MLLTYQDAIAHALDFVGLDASAQGLRDARLAVQDALRELHTTSNWSYLYTFKRLNTVAPYTTGTIEYDHTGGTSERLVELTGGTFPDSAYLGTLVIDGTPYEVERFIDDTHITLQEDSNPGEDVASGTAFTLYQDQYELPADYKSGFEFYANDQWHGMTYVHPKNWAFDRVRTDSTSSGTPLTYTVIGSVDKPGRRVIRVFPYPDRVYAYDYVYLRRPALLTIFEYKTGTVDTTTDSTTIDGTDTSWNTTMERCVMRISAVDTTIATGITEVGPYGFERSAYYVHETLIDSVEDVDEIIVVDAIPETLAGVRYVISSLIDIEGEIMTNALYRLIEKNMAIKKNMESKADYMELARRALVLAREADAPYAASRRITMNSSQYTREYDLHRPLGPDVM